MNMIIHQYPCHDTGSRSLHHLTHPAKKISSIFIIVKDPASLNAANHYMVKRSRGI
jgi:hypothetical protein